jgi:hypothetical protein
MTTPSPPKPAHGTAIFALRRREDKDMDYVKFGKTGLGVSRLWPHVRHSVSAF